MRNRTNPIVSIQNHLIRIKFPIKAPSYLSFPVAIETYYGQILKVIVTRVVVNMMNLNGLSLNAANAARSVGDE